MSTLGKPQEDVADLSRRLNAATRFVLSSVVPLALQNEDVLVCAGTGTLFEVNKRHFILTAQHVCQCDLATLFIPAGGNFDDRIVCENFKVHMPKERDDVDVAAIEISEVTIFELLRRGFKFLEPDRVDFRGPSERAIIVGYLKENYPLTGSGIMRSTTVLCQQINTPPDAKPPAVPELDFFYEYPATAYLVEDNHLRETGSPRLNGISGASVWEMLRVKGAWRPEYSVYITGIEVAYYRGRYARVQTWLAVALLLSRISLGIAEELSARSGYSVANLTARRPPGTL